MVKPDLALIDQLIQLDAVSEDDGVGAAAMGGVDFVEFFPSGGDFPLEGFDCFRRSFGHGHLFYGLLVPGCLEFVIGY